MKPVLEVIQDSRASPSFRVFEVHLTRKPSNWHYHPELELTWVISGEGTRFVGEHVGRFAAGDLMLTGQNLPHDFNVDAGSAGAEFLVVQFRPDLVDTLPEMASITELIQRAGRGLLFERADSDVTKELERLSARSPARQCVSLLDILCRLAVRNDGRLLCADTYVPAQLARAQLSRLNDVLDYVSGHYARAISLEEIAELTSMTPTSFCRWFKRTMDCSFFTYLNRYRVEQAERLLLSCDQAVNTIARDCGFDSISSFNRWFRRKTGVAPRQFRRRLLDSVPE